MTKRKVKALEFFAGIGGFACSWPEAEVVAAYDISELCQHVYQLNHPGLFLPREITSLGAQELTAWQVDLWWMSPPCQPFTSRGNRRDTEDPRCAAFLHLVELVPECLPSIIGVENVSGFRNSQAFDRLTATLSRLDYTIQFCDLCPTQLLWPNRRPRFYLLAARDPSDLRPWQSGARDRDSLLDARMPDLCELLEEVSYDSDSSLWLSAEQEAAFGEALDRVSLDSENAMTACFGSSYGKSILRAGSYLQTKDGLRRFTPREVARLMGYPDTYYLGNLSRRQQWKVLGNSLSIVAMRYVLSGFGCYESVKK